MFPITIYATIINYYIIIHYYIIKTIVERKRGEDKEKTRKAAEDCKQILDWGISIYPTRPAAAIHIWKVCLSS